MKKILFSMSVLALSAVCINADNVKKISGNDSIAAYQMSEVEVNASRAGTLLKDMPQKVEIITADKLKSLPNENLGEVLKRATNLDIIQYPGLLSAIGMRGFAPIINAPGYVLILINGKSAGTNNLSTITLDNVERVEVVKGPNSVLYGSGAMGGVINIITKRGTLTPQGKVSIESGSFGYTKLSSSFTGNSGDKLLYGLGYNYQQQGKDYRIGKNNLMKMNKVDSLILAKASYGDAMKNTKYSLNTANAFLDYKINTQWNARLDGSYTFANDVETNGNYWGSSGQSKKDINRLNLYLSVEQRNDKNHFRFSPFYTGEENSNYTNNTADGFVNFSSNTKEYGYQMQDMYLLGNLKFLVGHDLKVYNYLSNRFSGIGVAADPYKPNNKYTDLALFGQVAYVWQNLDVNAGIRYDYFNYHIDANRGLNAPDANTHYNTVNPTLGAQYTFLKDFKAHSSFGTAFFVPDAYQTAGKYSVKYTYAGVDHSTDYVGNADLKPEKSRTLDFGLAYNSQSTGLNVDVTYFHTLYNQKIITSTLPTGEMTYINADKSLMDGIELVSSFNFGKHICPTLNLEAYANFTWMLKNNVFQTIGGNEVTKEMLNVHKVNGNFGLNYWGNKVNMRFNGRYIGHRLEKDNFAKLRPLITAADYYTQGGYEAKDKILQHPRYITFDYSIGYDFTRKVNFGITVSNVFDENYSEKDGYNLAGRSIVAKLSYTF